MGVGLSEGLTRARMSFVLALQSGLAAGGAWLVAHNLVHHPRPFFAPIAAVIVLASAEGLRWRRAVELVLGVALGIALADALVWLVGVGVIQIACVVTLAILITVFLGGGSLAVAQAASSAVLVVTLAQPGGLNTDRFIDALIGGTTGLLVMMLLLPYNPLPRVRRMADAALSQLAEALEMTARGMRADDQDQARRALTDLRAHEHQYSDLKESLKVSREAATLAPVRWRSRPALQRYHDGAVHIERATRNVRVLARRSAFVVSDGEPLPPQLPEALDQLAVAARTLSEELGQGVEPERARADALRAAVTAADAYRAGLGFSGSVVVAQVRSATVDLLRATGLSEDGADEEIGRVGRLRS